MVNRHPRFRLLLGLRGFVCAGMVICAALSGACRSTERASAPTASAVTAPTTAAGPAPLSTLTVSGPSVLTGRSQTAQLQALATYSDGTTQEQTNAATWTSSNVSVASVTAGGLITTVGFGVADVSAVFQGREARLSVNVIPVTIEFAALSQGACGSATFQRNGTAFYSRPGCTLNGGRGFNVAAVSPTTGELLEPVRNFDTWYSGSSAARSMVDFLDRQPRGTVLLVAVGDEAGLTVGATSGCPRSPLPGTVCCQPLGGELERLRLSLESLGAAQVRRYCYWNSYSLVAIRGVGVVSEQLEPVSQAVSRYALTLP